jgi:predicted O-methyltransferase YrrM
VPHGVSRILRRARAAPTTSCATGDSVTQVSETELTDAAPEAPAADPGTPASGDATLICWPLDHYYSPIPDSRLLARDPDRSRVWPSMPRAAPGLDWRADEQVELLRGELARHREIEFADGPTNDPHEYHAACEMFSRLDAWVLQAMLRHLRPRAMVEVGCGWSSLVSARVNREYLDGSLRLTCIEPYPPEFLAGGVAGISGLIPARVEQTPLDPFLELGDGDVVFIDTSHTVKTGGDVVFLFEEVIPRLAPGVVVHIHDMFMPWDYPIDWVLSGRAWNEQYLVRAFLSFNSTFRILLSVGWLSENNRSDMAAVIPGYPDRYRDGGGSLWIRRERG